MEPNYRGRDDQIPTARDGPLPAFWAAHFSVLGGPLPVEYTIVLYHGSSSLNQSKIYEGHPPTIQISIKEFEKTASKDVSKDDLEGAFRHILSHSGKPATKSKNRETMKEELNRKWKVGK